MAKAVSKTGLLLLRAGRKIVTRPGDALLLGRIAWWVGVVSVASRCFPLPRALQIVAARKTRRSPTTGAADRLGRAVDLVLSADVLMFRPICWIRAAVLHRFLALNGIDTRIVFGVRSEGEGKVSGHAWLESGGKPILENTPPDHVVTYTYPSAERFDAQLATLSDAAKSSS